MSTRLKLFRSSDNDDNLGRREVENRLRFKVALILLFILLVSPLFASIRIASVHAAAAWPSSWIHIDWDRNEDGATDDWRDVQNAYFQYDSGYLYLKLQCYALPGSGWPSSDGRYKWFIDLDNNSYYSGGNIFDAEYLLFVEDTYDNGVGEMYLLHDANNDNNFGAYEPWPPANYANYMITNANIGGFRIVAPDQIEMYISWASIGSPSSYWLFWATDQANPNLDQGPTADRVDEERRISVENVAAVGQVPTPTTVTQGQNVTVQVTVENKGTLAETFNVTCYFDNTAIGTKLVSSLAAGHQQNLTFVWNTSGIPSGSYSIEAWADSSGAIAESDETDNWCTAAATVTVLGAAVHDVVAVSQVPDKTKVLNGTLVNVNVTVSNPGDFAETFNVTCYYDSSPIGYQTVANLASKATTSMIFVWNTSAVEPGTYFIEAVADSGNAIAEVDEENNNCTSFVAVTVYSLGEEGSLFVDKAETSVVSGQDPPVVGFPTVYELTVIVSNFGGSNVTNVVVNDSISSDVAFVSVGTPSKGSIVALPPPRIVWNVGTLTPGGSATLTFRVRATPVAAGLLYLNHEGDLVTSGVDQLSGQPVNDTGHSDVTVTAIVRDVAATGQTPSSTVVPQGNTVAVQVTVKNFGNVSETFDVACYYDGTQIDVMRVYNLPAGGQTTIPFAWDTTGVPTGTYSISAKADSSGEIDESNETNNVCTSPATVRIVVHDVAILSQAPSPTTVVKGGVVTISVVVKNEGTEAETFNVGCFYNDTLLEIRTVTNLQPGVQTTLSFLWNTSSVQAGLYFINTEASTVPDEKDTSDNACRSVNAVTVTLPPSPLVVHIVPLDSTISLGQWVDLTSAVTGGTGPFTFEWYLGGGLVPGSNSSAWRCSPSAPGVYYVYLKVTDAGSNTAQSETARVRVLPPTPVGGYAISLPKPTWTMNNSVAEYVAFLVMLSAAIVLVKRKRE